MLSRLANLSSSPEVLHVNIIDALPTGPVRRNPSKNIEMASAGDHVAPRKEIALRLGRRPLCIVDWSWLYGCSHLERIRCHNPMLSRQSRDCSVK